MDKDIKTKVWIMCEAFTLTGDAFWYKQTVHESLTPYAVACADKKSCLKALRKSVEESVRENYEGLDDEFEERTASDVNDVLSNPKKCGRGVWRYNYSKDDREIVWRIYPMEVIR
jgi:hypothetical protein